MLAIVPPVIAFVAAGFEHSIANMYLLPIGLLIKHGAPASFWTQIAEQPGSFAALTPASMAANLLPVTIGNMIGGGVLVGGVYWFIYLRKGSGVDDVAPNGQPSLSQLKEHEPGGEETTWIT